MNKIGKALALKAEVEKRAGEAIRERCAEELYDPLEFAFAAGVREVLSQLFAPLECGRQQSCEREQ